MNYLKELKAPLPAEALSPIKDTKLTAINATFLIERMNDVFGLGWWNFYYTPIEPIHAGSFVVEGFIEYKVPHGEKRNTPKQYGGSLLLDYTHEGDARKAAVTNCFSKCTGWLEIGHQVRKSNNEDKQTDGGDKKELNQFVKNLKKSKS